MRKKTLVQKICALALTFAMVTGPVSYARAEEPSPQNVKETVVPEASEMDGVIPEGTEGLGAAAPTDGGEQPEQAGTPAGGERERRVGFYREVTGIIMMHLVKRQLAGE